jgi:hypothetical protein
MLRVMTAAQFKRLFPARACSGLAWRLVIAANDAGKRA